jgi:hypothetical protein
VKLHRALLNDPVFINLSPSSRFLYLGLIFLATESGNRVYGDRTWIAQRLYTTCTEVDLTPLYRAGLLETSNLRRLLREGERDREREGEGEREQVAPARKVSKKLSDEEWLKELKANPAYRHINIDDQLSKMDAWLSVHPGRQKSRPFIVNWLNKIEKPLSIVPIKPAIMTKVTPSLPPGEECPEGAQELLNRLMGGLGKAM